MNEKSVYSYLLSLISSLLTINCSLFTVNCYLLPDSQDAVGLEGESPLGVVEHGLDGGLHVAEPLFLILDPAGLQVAVGGGDVVVLGQVLAQIDHLEFVAAGEHHGQVAAVAKACFGRQGHPVDAVGQGTGAVGLDGDAFARHGLEAVHKILVDP